MFRIAAGEELPFSQADICQQGWAIEARVYAENPFRGFLPSLGTVFGYSEPATNVSSEHSLPPSSLDGLKVPERVLEVGFDSGGVRIDSGIADGVVVSSYYDPLLSKVISYGPDRDTAIDRLGEALDSYVIGGFQTNISFLRAVTRNNRFRTGDITTNFVSDEYPDTVSVVQSLKASGSDKARGFGAGITLNHDELVDALAVVGKMYFDEAEVSVVAIPPSGRSPCRCMFEAYDVTGSKLCSGELELVEGTGLLAVTIGEVDGETEADIGMRSSSDIMRGRKERKIRILGVQELAGGDSGVVAAEIDGKRSTLSRRGSTPHGGAGVWKVMHKGSLLDVRVGRVVEEELVRQVGGWPVSERRSNGLGSDGTVRAPMAGHVVSIAVQVGDAVGVGQEVIVLEAMKMQNSLKSDVAGVVRAIRNVRPGDAVAIDQPLIELELLKASGKT
jgi:propionyl-CoA carboxylase alpha chain